MTPRTCTRCAAPVAEGARFCRACGAPVDAPTTATVAAPPPADPPTAAPAPPASPAPAAAPSEGRGFLPLLIAAIVAFGALGGVGSYLLLRDDGNADTHKPAPGLQDGGGANGSGDDSGTATSASTAAAGPSTDESAVPDDWPDGRAGFTVALASMGDSAGADRMATRARDAGIEPGVLETGDYGSLTPGYWFVYSGTFETAFEARSIREAAQDAGFADAYVTFVSREEQLPGDDASPELAGKQRLQDQDWFSIEVPGDWPLVTNQVDYGSFTRSRWVHPDAPAEVKLTIDSTRSVSRGPVALAREVRGQTSKSDDYEEISFGRTTLNGTNAAEWRFRLGDVAKVDYFVNVCGGGVAVLGAAPADSFETHADVFTEAANTVTGTAC
jgi:hypothetical protein